MDEVYEKGLRSLFSGPVSAFVAGGTNPDGVHFDARQTFQPRDKGYMNALKQALREQNLSYIRVDRGIFGRKRQ